MQIYIHGFILHANYIGKLVWMVLDVVTLVETWAIQNKEKTHKKIPYDKLDQ